MNGEGSWQEGRLKSAAAALGVTLGMMLALRTVGWLGAVTLGGASGRSAALGRLGAAALTQWLLIAAIVQLFRQKGIPRLERPWRESGRGRAWGGAALLWLLLGAPMILQPTAQVPVLEPSLFNLVGSLLAGPGAGAAEEVIFRGLLMALLAAGGWSPWRAVLLTSFLFGLSHVGWGMVAADPAVALMAVGGTTVLGLAFGVLYLLAGRRILPAVVAHAAINLVIEPWLVLSAVQGTFGVPGQS